MHLRATIRASSRPIKDQDPHVPRIGGPDYRRVSRNLALDLVRVTEAGALAGARWLGRGDKEGADQAAVDAMRHVLSFVPMRGTVVIGEGEKDEAPMLFNGESVGDGTGDAMDVAVDPLDGTRLTAFGRDGALSVIAIAPEGTLYDPGPVMYMDKLAVQKKAAGLVDLGNTVEQNIRGVALALEKEIDDVTVVMLDRPRHAELLKSCREAGARIKLITDGDVEASVAAATPGTNVDLMLGVGGTPEGVISATALRCMGAKFQGRLAPRNDEEKDEAIQLGYVLDKILNIEDLCKSGDVFFAATGVSNGDLLKGVRFDANGAISHSIVMRSASGTIRYMETHHQWQKQTLQEIGVVDPRKVRQGS